MANYWNAIFYNDDDYVGFDIPTSEGGRGPENAREVLGLEIDHHAGMEVVRLAEGQSIEQAAYQAMRESRPFLTDDNHTWKIEPGEHPYWMSRLVVTKNEKSGYFTRIPGLDWMILNDGPGAHWFSERFRVATVGMIAAEIAADRARAQRYLDEAARQKDTIKGRKRAHQLHGFSRSALWLAETAPGRRWPEHFAREAVPA